MLPDDLLDYFRTMNGTGNEYDEDFFQFYTLNNIKKVRDEYIDWRGVPDHENIINALPDVDDFYVFSNYSCNLFAYAIRLNPGISTENEVIVICGERYKKLANSFTEFIELFLNKSRELQLE